MAKCKVNVVKKGATRAASAPSGAKANGKEVTIEDLGGGKFLVTGHDDQGRGGIDMSTTGTLVAVSSDASIATVDSPVGMSAKVSGVKAGSATIILTVTANDGSYGPFGFDVGVNVIARTPTGLDVEFVPA